MTVLEGINNPSDVKKLNLKQLKQLAEELRGLLSDTIKETGGHLASNLGVVELTLALIKVFDFPFDKVVWDVGHQSYVYKILTGRKAEFTHLRTTGGISGFPNTNESPYDCFNTGHSTTSISAALGLVRARDLNRGAQNVISVIGDGALTGGMAWEALNDLGASRTKMLVILNDNDMSINQNVGGVSKHLSKIRLNKNYTKLKLRVTNFAKRIPLIGLPIYRCLRKAKDRMKMALVKGKIFEQIGLNYIGPIDGHNLKQLIEFLEYCKDYQKPVLMHIVTKKGKGNIEAEDNPTVFHGVSPLRCAHTKSFSLTAGQTLCELAQKSGRVVAITAAMQDGTGLNAFATTFPKRFFDVGIAEQHAVTMAAGMAVGGLKPYCFIYSTFLQRAYDQILHDVCLQDLPVTFCIDRAGIIGSDGATHQGLFDLSFLRAMPHMTIAVPSDPCELEEVLHWSLTYPHPLAIRYPKEVSGCCGLSSATAPVSTMKWSGLQGDGSEQIVFLACGDRCIEIALKTTEFFQAGQCAVFNARFVKPIDWACLDGMDKNRIVVVMEDNMSPGGLFGAVAEYYASHNIRNAPQLLPFSVPEDTIVEFGEIDECFDRLGLTKEKLYRSINKLLSDLHKV